MKAELFYAITSGASLLALTAEVVYGRRKRRNWHAASDTIGNLNLAAGNVVLGIALAGIIAAGYAAVYAIRVVDVTAKLSPLATVVIAVVFADFLQYWNHRLSHRVNLLWWGHITHHSSSHLNLSTAFRVNWLYRAYAWILYAPMPLLGFSLESFVLSQAVINVYNMFMHTRCDVPFGPLGWLLVTPRSHRLHHSANPKYFGNYGAAFIVWDRIFGTYRELAKDETEVDLAFGVDRNVDTPNPITLNFGYLHQLALRSRLEGRSFAGLLLSTTSLPSRTEPVAAPPRLDISRFGWLGVAGIAALALVLNQLHARLSLTGEVLAVAFAIALVTAFGVSLERRVTRPEVDEAA